MNKDLRLRVYNKFDGHCAYCGKNLEYKDMQVDHYWPKTLAHWFHNRPEFIESLENLMPSCRRCNHYKRSLQPEDWRTRMNTLHERIEQEYINKVAIDFGIINIRPFDGKFFFERAF